MCFWQAVDLVHMQYILVYLYLHLCICVGDGCVCDFYSSILIFFTILLSDGFFLRPQGLWFFSIGVVVVKSEYSVHVAADLKPEDRAVYRVNLNFLVTIPLYMAEKTLWDLLPVLRCLLLLFPG